MIERTSNPLDRLRVVHPNPPRSGLITERELVELRAWSVTGKALTAAIVVGCGLYVLAACVGWVR